MHKFIGFAVGIALVALPAVSFADSNVTATAGAGATVSPSGAVFLVSGATQTFLAGALSGYTLSDVSVDGVSQGAVGSVDVTGDVVDHTVDVSATQNAPTGGGSLLFCSGPEAPGYTVGKVGGGCGATTTFVPFNGASCLFMQGCMIANASFLSVIK
jgi:hypothetical protein